MAGTTPSSEESTEENPRRAARLARDARIGARLRAAIAGRLSQNQAATIADVSAKTFGLWLTGRASADAGGVLLLAKHLGLPVGELLDEPGSPAADVAAMFEQSRQLRCDAIGPASDFVRVPIVDVAVSAGPGREPGSEETTGIVVMSRNELRRLGDPDRLQLVRIHGDSAEPELRDGDLALVDTSRTDRLEGLLVVSIDHELLAKRLRRRGDGRIELLSTNLAYPPMEVDLDRSEVWIKGKVVSAWKAY